MRAVPPKCLESGRNESVGACIERVFVKGLRSCSLPGSFSPRFLGEWVVSKKPYEFDQDWTIFDLDKAMTDFDFVVDIRKSQIASLESC